MLQKNKKLSFLPTARLGFHILLSSQFVYGYMGCSTLLSGGINHDDDDPMLILALYTESRFRLDEFVYNEHSCHTLSHEVMALINFSIALTVVAAWHAYQTTILWALVVVGIIVLVLLLSTCLAVIFWTSASNANLNNA